MEHIIKTMKKTQVGERKDVEIEEIIDEEIDNLESIQMTKQISADSTGSVEESKDYMAIEGSSLTTNEEDEIINVEWKSYLKYMRLGKV